MSCLPVIARELRAQARHPFTFWLRGSGVLVLLVGGMWLLNERGFEPNVGGYLYGRLHLMAYFALWLLVPLGAADCISRERREGTLGLLFLTPLQPPHIVIAKGFVHGLRAATLAVALVPVLTIPFLLGGVVWQQAALSTVIYFDAICWCLAAALVASSLARNNNRAMAFTMLFACLGFIGFPWIVGMLMGINSPMTWNQGYTQSTYDFFVGFWVVAMPAGDFSYVLRMFKLTQIVTAISIASMVSISVLVFAVLFAARRIRRAWRDQPPSASVEKMERAFLRPVIGKGFLHRWMQRKLERNPIGWLEQRQWSGRMVTWVWLAIIITLYSIVMTDSRYANFFLRGSGIQMVVCWLLMLSMAVTAAGSFRRERETGVLELLLVSPLTARQIINGRLRGLWGQFLPALVALLGIALYLLLLFHGTSFGNPDLGYVDLWFFAITFWVTPVIGLYFSVRCRHYLAGVLLTLGMAMVLPIVLSSIVRAGVDQADLGDFSEVRNEHLAWFFQLLVAAYLNVALHRKLERRQFPLERALG